MDTKTSIEQTLLIQLKALEDRWPATVEDEGDDSSDEEDVECSLRRPFQSVDPAGKTVLKDLSSIVHELSLHVYWAPDVNAIYYQEKQNRLSGNQLKLTPEEVEKWIEITMQYVIDTMFSATNLSRFFKRYTEVIKEVFLKKYEKHLIELKRTMTEFFLLNPQLLLRIISAPDSVDPIYFYKLVHELWSLLKEFFTDFQMDYSHKSLQISEKILARELKDRFSAEIKAKAKQYLEETDLAVGNTFAGKASRDSTLDDTEGADAIEAAVLAQVRRKITRSTQRIDTFLVECEEIFLEAHFGILITDDTRKGLLKANTTSRLHVGHYGVVRANRHFKDSLFGELETEYLAVVTKRLDMVTLHETFVRGIVEGRKHFTKMVFLERTLLPADFHFTHQSVLHPLVFVRLSNRSQTRMIRQRDEDVRQGGVKEKVTVLRSIAFPCISNMGLETQDLSCNNVRSDKVENMEKYSTISQKLSDLMRQLNMTDRAITIAIRNVLRNQPVTPPPNVLPPQIKKLHHFLAHFVYLLFITEPTRHPSSWLTHQMLLDLIIANKLTWQEALTIHSVADKKHPPMMPMAIEGAVEGARALAAQWMTQMPRRYVYQGNENYDTAKKLTTAESALISLWFENCTHHRACPKTSKEVVVCITDAIQRWYGIIIEPKLKIEKRSSLLMAYELRREHRKKKEIKATLPLNLPVQLPSKAIRLIADYAYEPPKKKPRPT